MKTIKINLSRLPYSYLRQLETNFDCTIRLTQHGDSVTIDPDMIEAFIYCLNAMRSKQIEMNRPYAKRAY